MAAVLGGTQSLHTNSMVETLALPSEKAAEIALRTQQLLAFETGVANVADPLGGSWFIESLTDQIEQEAEKYFGEIESIGGVIPAIESGYFQREISIAASNYQRKIDDKKLIHVGVNDFKNENEEIQIPILEISADVEKKQIKALEKLKHERDENIAREALSKIKEACKNNLNIMVPIIEAAKSHVTMGEIVEIMKTEFGEWQETAVF
jgi:methylmalonyl-CoA mutase N-terminal domain/subunit